MSPVVSFFSGKTVSLLFLVFIFGILLYLPSIKVPFINDEIAFIERNQVQNFSQLHTLFEKKDYDGVYYRPIPNFISGLITLCFNFNYSLYRIFNLVLHSIAGILIFILCSYLINRHKQVKYISLFAALFFLAFPLHDYAVIWHTDLFDRIMLIFYLGALISFIKNDFKPGIISLMLFTFSLLSKEMAFSFPAIIFLLSFLFLEERYNWKKSIRITFPYVIISIGFILFRIIFFNNNIFTDQGAHSANSLFTIIKNYFFFGGLLVFPFFIREIEQLILHYKLILIPAGAVSLALFIFLLKKLKKDIILIFFILFIIITIAPASRLMMRWYLYLPSVGFTAALSYLIFTIDARDKILLAISLLLLFIYSSALLIKESKWIEYAANADQILKNFVSEFGSDVKGKEIDFLTIPAKVNDIPVFQLGFNYHLNYYLRENNKREVYVYSNSVLNSFKDSIVVKKSKNGYFLKQFRDNYFILFGNQKYIKFDTTNYEGHVPLNREQRDTRIQAILINPEDNNKILFTFSNGKFIKISDSAPKRGNGKD